MTKKEFKKKCKAEKAMCYKLMLAGGIVSVIGLIIVIATLAFISAFDASLIGYGLGGIIALIGMVLDLMGEAVLSKEFKAYEQE